MSRPGQCGLESVVAGSFEMASKSTWLSVEFTALCRVCLTELSAITVLCLSPAQPGNSGRLGSRRSVAAPESDRTSLITVTES
eukprot:764011-Hanusia_phi.AAC.1